MRSSPIVIRSRGGGEPDRFGTVRYGGIKIPFPKKAPATSFIDRGTAQIEFDGFGVVGYGLVVVDFQISVRTSFVECSVVRVESNGVSAGRDPGGLPDQVNARREAILPRTGLGIRCHGDSAKRVHPHQSQQPTTKATHDASLPKSTNGMNPAHSAASDGRSQ